MKQLYISQTQLVRQGFTEELLQNRNGLLGNWFLNLRLYEFYPSSAHSTILDDFLPFHQQTNRFFRRKLDRSAVMQQYQAEEDRKYFRIMKNVIDNQFDSLHDQDFISIRQNFGAIVNALIRGQLPNVSLLQFLRCFESESMHELVLSLSSRDNYLPQELLILFNYMYDNDERTFEQLWEYFKQIGVDRQARPDVVLRFAIEAGNVACLRYFMPDYEFEECFFNLDLHTYAVINYRAFAFLMQFYERRGMLERLLLRKDKFGYIPVHAAALIGNMDVLSSVVQHCSCLHVLADDGMSVLECTFCSYNTLAQRFIFYCVIDVGDKIQAEKCRSKFKLNYFHLSLIFKDADALSLLKRYGNRALMDERCTIGVTPVDAALAGPDPKYLHLIAEMMTRQQLQDIFAQYKAPNEVDSDEYCFVSPIETLRYNYLHRRNFIHAHSTKIVIALYFAVFSLAFILPPMLLNSSYIKTSHFMVSESIMFVAFSYNIVMLFMINFAWKPAEDDVKITEIKDFRKMAYCVQGDRILMDSAYFHCEICNKCQPVGSYHSSLIGLCVYKNQRWMYVSSIASALLAFLIYLQLIGHQNTVSMGLAVVQAIFQMIVVGMITILSVTLASFIIFLFHSGVMDHKA